MKKIKDLTLEETKKICLKNNDCIECPLYLNLYLCVKDLLCEEKLNQEIEVDEDEK